MSKSAIDIWCSVVAFHTPPEELEKLASTLSQVQAEVALTIVDNSSVLPLLLTPDSLHVEVLRPGANLGYGRAHNLVIRQSQGRCRYHLVMNSDISFEPEVIDELLRFMDSRPSAGLVMPMVRYPNGDLQYLCRLLPNPMTLIGRRFFADSKWSKMLNRNYELHEWGYDEIASFPFLSGCFMFMRRNILDKVGGFDPRYFLYAEDLDLSRRLHAISETLFYPGVYITHEYRSLKRRSLKQWVYGLRSLSQYFNKWGWVFDPERDRINARVLKQLSKNPDRGSMVVNK